MTTPTADAEKDRIKMNWEDKQREFLIDFKEGDSNDVRLTSEEAFNLINEVRDWVRHNERCYVRPHLAQGETFEEAVKDAQSHPPDRSQIIVGPTQFGCEKGSFKKFIEDNHAEAVKEIQADRDKWWLEKVLPPEINSLNNYVADGYSDCLAEIKSNYARMVGKEPAK